VGEGRAKVVILLPDIQLLHPVTATILGEWRGREGGREGRREGGREGSEGVKEGWTDGKLFPAKDKVWAPSMHPYLED